MSGTQPESKSPLAVFLAFLRLGLTSFGGPVAHLAFLRSEFVERRKWVRDSAYSDLVALCQFLPGPASSQVGMALGASRAGFLGAVTAWVGFTLPSAALLTLAGLGLVANSGLASSGWIHGLKIAAAAVVCEAIWKMSRSLCPDRPRITIAGLTATGMLLIPGSFTQVVLIAAAGLWTLFFPVPVKQLPHAPLSVNLSPRLGGSLLGLWVLLLVVLPICAGYFRSPFVELIDSFYRIGSLVFGGGHVVLPLLQEQVVHSGWVTNDLFLAGYGLAQAVPGPLFSFAAFLGAVALVPPGGVVGACVALVAIFLPSLLLVIGILPFWERLRANERIQRALPGVNASVVGLLIAAFISPVWPAAILNAFDFALFLVSFILLVRFAMPSWAVVAFAALIASF